jgi:tRNA(fMet)-specific endonuclease VapC
MINACVIDTDVISYIFKSDSRASLYFPHLDGNLGLISFMTLAELRQWSLVRDWGERRLRELELFLARYHVIQSDDYLCSLWAEIRRDALKHGSPIDTADA